MISSNSTYPVVFLSGLLILLSIACEDGIATSSNPELIVNPESIEIALPESGSRKGLRQLVKNLNCVS